MASDGHRESFRGDRYSLTFDYNDMHISLRLIEFTEFTWKMNEHYAIKIKLVLNIWK